MYTDKSTRITKSAVMFTTRLKIPVDAKNTETKLVMTSAFPGMECLLSFDVDLKNKPARETANNIRGAKSRTAFKIPNKDTTEMIVTIMSPLPPNINCAASAPGNTDLAIF